MLEDDRKTSVINLFNLLLQIASGDPARGPQVEDLSRQDSLAAWSSVEQQIFPSSLNTLKRCANAYLTDGFCSLDLARRKAHEKLIEAAERGNAPSSRNKSGLQDEIKDLKECVVAMGRDLWHLSNAFNAAMRLAENYSKEPNLPHVRARYEIEAQEVRARLTLVQRKLGSVLGGKAADEDNGGSDGAVT
jgi:hypothetical protein